MYYEDPDRIRVPSLSDPTVKAEIEARTQKINAACASSPEAAELWAQLQESGATGFGLGAAIVLCLGGQPLK